MKTTILIALLIISLFKVNGQAVLEKSFPGEYINSEPVLLTNYGWVYPTIMYNSNITLKIYAADYTLLKSIYLEIPEMKFCFFLKFVFSFSFFLIFVFDPS